MQYPLGFRQLGHEVLYIEDTGKWFYDADQSTFVPQGEQNVRKFTQAVASLDEGRSTPWFVRDALGESYGLPWDQVVDFCDKTDLFVHISASCLMRDEYLSARRIAFVDTDPVYTQAALLNGTPDEVQARLEWWRTRHQTFFTFGENIGTRGCKIPNKPFNWIATRQPIVLDCFKEHTLAVEDRRRMLTTVASWEPSEQGPVLDGTAYAGKSAEFERFIDLPSRSPLPTEIAMSGPAPDARLKSHGWVIRDGYGVSRDPWVYRNYLACSLGEWSVAKNAYVDSHSGWFSCRSACYLALGVPAIVQDTGFSKFIPTGEGVLAFNTIDEAEEGIARVAGDPKSHARAARSIAEEYFDSDKVLTHLLNRAMG